jgi:Flp pilus assembly protein CpaB
MGNENQTASLKLSKNRKIIIVLTLAIFFAFGAGLGAYSLLTPQRTAIFVFNQDYSAGTQISKSMLTSIQVDNGIITGGTRLSTGDYFITDRDYNAVIQSAGILRVDVHGGTALMTSMLTTTGGNSIEMNMKKNAIAVTIAVDNITGVTDELTFGARVNVYTSYNGETVLMLQNIRVLKTTSNNGLSSVTLETDHEQSLELIYAYTFGVVHLGLVDANGYQYTAIDRPTYNYDGFIIPASTDPNADGYEWQPENNYTANGTGTGTIDDPIESEDENNPVDILIPPVSEGR